MLHHAHHYMDMLFLGLIPWWFYVVVSIAAAIIILFEVPTRLGLVLGLAVSLFFASVGFSAKGFQLGTMVANEKHEQAAQVERDRLKREFATQRDTYLALIADAQAQYADLKKESDDAIASVNVPAPPAETLQPILSPGIQDATVCVPPPVAGSVVISPDVAQRLYDIGRKGAGTRGSLGHPTRSPGRTGLLQSLLRKGNGAAYP